MPSDIIDEEERPRDNDAYTHIQNPLEPDASLDESTETEDLNA